MDRVVAGADGQLAAEDRHVIVAVDAVVGRGDVDGGAVDDQHGLVAGLDAVLGAAVDGQRTGAGDIRAGARLDLDRRAVVGVGHVRVGGVLIVGVLGVRQRHAAGDDDLDLGFLVDGERRALAAGQIQILEHQHDARRALGDGNAAVGAGAGDDVGARRLDLDFVVLIRHGDGRRAAGIRLQRRRAVGGLAGDDLCRGAGRGDRGAGLHPAEHAALRLALRLTEHAALRLALRLTEHAALRLTLQLPEGAALPAAEHLRLLAEHLTAAHTVLHADVVRRAGAHAARQKGQAQAARRSRLNKLLFHGKYRLSYIMIDVFGPEVSPLCYIIRKDGREFWGRAKKILKKAKRRRAQGTPLSI